METFNIEERLKNIERLLFTNKKALTIDELVSYTGLSKSHVYKLTCSLRIPHFKPRGKQIYFDKHEIDSWLLMNRVGTKEEIESDAINYLITGKMGGRHA